MTSLSRYGYVTAYNSYQILNIFLTKNTFDITQY